MTIDRNIHTNIYNIYNTHREEGLNLLETTTTLAMEEALGCADRQRIIKEC
jgi:hypothetical protein